VSDHPLAAHPLALTGFIGNAFATARTVGRNPFALPEIPPDSGGAGYQGDMRRIRRATVANRGGGTATGRDLDAGSLWQAAVIVPGGVPRFGVGTRVRDGC